MVHVLYFPGLDRHFKDAHMVIFVEDCAMRNNLNRISQVGIGESVERFEGFHCSGVFALHVTVDAQSVAVAFFYFLRTLKFGFRGSSVTLSSLRLSPLFKHVVYQTHSEKS